MKWTQETAVAAVLSFKEDKGYQPVKREGGPRHGLPTWHTARDLFGSWNAMIEAAGLRPYPAQNTRLAKVMAWRDRNRNVERGRGR